MPPTRRVRLRRSLSIDLDPAAAVHQPVHRRDGRGAGGEHVLTLAECLIRGDQQGPVTARTDDAPAAGQAAINNVAELSPFSIGGGLSRATSG